MKTRIFPALVISLSSFSPFSPMLPEYSGGAGVAHFSHFFGGLPVSISLSEAPAKTRMSNFFAKSLAATSLG